MEHPGSPRESSLPRWTSKVQIASPALEAEKPLVCRCLGNGAREHCPPVAQKPQVSPWRPPRSGRRCLRRAAGLDRPDCDCRGCRTTSGRGPWRLCKLATCPCLPRLEHRLDHDGAEAALDFLTGMKLAGLRAMAGPSMDRARRRDPRRQSNVSRPPGQMGWKRYAADPFDVRLHPTSGSGPTRIA
jgi:hypothetical protein